MADSVRSKACTNCGELRLLTDFYRKKEASDGRHSHCKTCRNSYRKTRPPSANYRETNLAYYYRNKSKWQVTKARRRAAELNAIPSWNDTEYEQFVLEEVYSFSKLKSTVLGIPHEVDHIVPLQNKLVCGLHTSDNLQVIPMVTNRSKSNTFVV